MIEIKEIDEGLFRSEKEQYQFIIGEYATYNRYYKIIVQQKSNIDIGLMSISTGIKPQVLLYNNMLLVGAGDGFFIYDLNGDLIKNYSTFPAFYEFIIKEQKILIISELSVLLLDSTFNKVWERDFNEIIDLNEIKDNDIILRDFNGNFIHLNFLTGE